MRTSDSKGERQMRFDWMRPFQRADSDTLPLARDDDLPEIRPGAFAAWARAADADLRPHAPGDACVTADGRQGRLVEAVRVGRPALVCEVA